MMSDSIYPDTSERKFLGATARELTGQKFGKLTAISRNPQNKYNGAAWNCICDCGNETVISAKSLRSGDTKSCGCLLIEYHHNRKMDRVGKVYGRWTVLSASDKKPNSGGDNFWNCQCSCGNYGVVSAGVLSTGHSTSCGCYQKEQVSQTGESSRRYRHGNKTKEFMKFKLSQMSDNCEICGRNDVKLCWDHDHNSPLPYKESYRGTLCSTCNRVLGMFRDNISRFENAANYLKQGVKSQRNSNE